ncbi:MAG: hypothetical protein Q9209_004011 [Squamulea sp. 1 TL-2023]
MALRYSISLLSLAFSIKVQCQLPSFEPKGELAFADLNKGWCYFCSDDGAPPLCNKQCESAISQLCTGDLEKGWTNIVGDCEVNYFPPIYSGRNRVAVPENTCTSTFTSMLQMCGKDAGDDKPYSSQYCTSSGGGGTYGWNDDSSPMVGPGRYTITTKGTNQCGQNEASWHLATGIIDWNDTWITETDQVIYDTNPPDMPDFPEPPAPNPLCNQVTCDIFDKPYFVNKTKPNWHEKDGYTRHQVTWQGWSDDAAATQFKKSLKDRCHQEPYNWQPYMNGDNHVADFELVHDDVMDTCWCIADAIYDASGGIKIDRKTWCEEDDTRNTEPEFSPVG